MFPFKELFANCKKCSCFNFCSGVSKKCTQVLKTVHVFKFCSGVSKNVPSFQKCSSIQKIFSNLKIVRVFKENFHVFYFWEILQKNPILKKCLRFWNCWLFQILFTISKSVRCFVQLSHFFLKYNVLCTEFLKYNPLYTVYGKHLWNSETLCKPFSESH